MQDSFKFYIPLDIEKATNSEGKEEMKIKGIASTGAKDSQNEYLSPKDFDLSEFKYINWNHKSKDDPATLIGEPTYASVNDKNELYIEGILYPEVPMAKATWNLMKALRNSPGGNKLGMSVEGKVIARDPINPNKITKSKITGVAICPVPVNGNTWTDLITKGFTDDVEPIYDMKEYVDEEMEKSMSHKYFKREGTPGNYKYYYTEADYKSGKESPEPKNTEIKGILDYINEQTGLTLNSEDEKITKKAGKRFFNVTLKQNTSESNEYDLLEKFANKYKLIKIEPNGQRRVAIFINDGSKFEKAISVEGTTGSLENEGVDRKIEIEDVDGFDTKKKKKDKKEIDEKLDPKPVTLSKATIYENIFNYFYIDEINKAKQIYKLIENISIMEKTPITSESIQKALDILNIAQLEVEKSQDIEAIEEVEKAEVEDIEKAAKVKKAEDEKEVEEKDEKEEDDDKEEKENPFQKGFNSEVYKSAMSEMKAMIKKGMKKEDVEKAMDCNYSKSLVKAVAQECSLMDNKANGGEISTSSISKSEIDEIVKSQLDEMIDIMKSSNDSFNEKFSAIGTIAKSQNEKIDEIVKSFEIISQENKALHERLQAVEKTSPGPKSMISKSFVDRFEAPTSTNGEVYNISNRHDRSMLIEKSFDLAIKGDNEFADICTSLESTGKLTDRNLRKLATAGIKVVSE